MSGERTGSIVLTGVARLRGERTERLVEEAQIERLCFWGLILYAIFSVFSVVLRSVRSVSHEYSWHVAALVGDTL